MQTSQRITLCTVTIERTSRTLVALDIALRIYGGQFCGLRRRLTIEMGCQRVYVFSYDAQVQHKTFPALLDPNDSRPIEESLVVVDLWSCM